MSNVPAIVVLIPSYNTGPILQQVVRSALEQHPDVWLLIDGSTDSSWQDTGSLLSEYPGFRRLVRSNNLGKGATLLEGAKQAAKEGFTHFISMDADGQHPASHLPALVAAVIRHPASLIMGRPVFDRSAPLIRLWGRKLTIALTDIESGFEGLGDTLYGFRAYPIGAFLQAFETTRFARGYDFDPEIAVRIFWQGILPVQVPVPLHYWTKEEGGVSHFHYFRDNCKLTFLHFRLIPEYFLFHFGRVHSRRTIQNNR